MMSVALVLLLIICAGMVRALYVLIREREDHFELDRLLRRELRQAGLLEMYEQLWVKARMSMK